MSVVDDLKAARELIADPNHWTKGSFARDASGQTCSPTSEFAVCWCASGALRKVEGCQLDDLPVAWDYLSTCVPGGSVAAFNDGARLHAAVLKMYDKAIALAEQAF